MVAGEAEWELDEPIPLGAPAIYRNLRRWLGSIGIELGARRTVAAVTAEPPSEAVQDAIAAAGAAE